MISARISLAQAVAAAATRAPSTPDGPCLPLSLDHLPDASEELARTSDLTIEHQGASLPLHSQVLASGSRVLRTALCGDAGGGSAAGRTAAVQQAFQGHSLEDVCTFLRLMYNSNAGCSMVPMGRLRAVLTLADKLDYCTVLDVSREGGISVGPRRWARAAAASASAPTEVLQAM